ncbi:M48 family metallopeptidase [Arsukibacterium perlucidum]|uniref:M48 family metallopeptidase n=1 Tax=Arsukibacterium perlucidum TaxID=368811 RepID=UPI00146F2B2C|nr:SprT family zinc-dependent metalloprotease [Arsukibacterium perlucidum]
MAQLPDLQTTEQPLPDYHIVFSRRRTLAIVVRQGRVTVRAPVGCNTKQIQQLIVAKQLWIRRHLLKQQAQMPVLSWQQSAQILFEGKLLQVVFCRAGKSEVLLDNDNVIIAVSARVATAKLAAWHDKLLHSWLKAQAEARFPTRLSFWADFMKVNYRELKLGMWQRRWGYCDSFGVIGLNWRLIMAPNWVSDYVMVHELAHLRVMDHSVRFWQTVSQYLPDYPQAQAWLSYNQRQLVE